MDKGDTINVTLKFKATLKEALKKYPFTDTEKRAIEFADELYKQEIARLESERLYQGG